MHIDIYVTTNGPYKVEFLNSDYSQMNNPYIAPQTNMVPVSGKLIVPAPSGTYTIPLIKVTNLTDGVVSMAYAYPVHCGANPTPTAPPTPVAPPTPIYIPPAPTPVAACADCRSYLITPTGSGPGAIWTVNYKDCNNVNQSTSGNGLDSPRERYMCVGSINITGQAKVETTGSPVAPTPSSNQTPAPTPIASGPIPTLTDYAVSNNQVTLYFEGGSSGSVTIQLKKAGTVVGTLTASYVSTMIVSSSQYGYIDVYVGDYDIGTVYIPQQLSGGWMVQKSKSVDETGVMNLQFIKAGNDYVVQDLVNNSGWPNVEYWHNSTLIGSFIPENYSIEPLIDQHITKKRWGNFEWLGSDNDGKHREISQLTFKIVSDVNNSI
jgi:hypothetical protein